MWGYQHQLYQDFEIIIADDGSSAETANLIAKLKQELKLNIRHVWHSDKGFRKCRILNKAILHAQYEYIVFTDGDCIPRNDFLSEHVQNANPGYYLSGSYIKLPMATSKAITQEDVASGRCFELAWLKNNGLKPGRKHKKLNTSKRAARILNRLTPTKCNLKGSNASVWAKDLRSVNGFDERMAWGGLDRELGVRLINSGIKAKHVRYNAICVHLDHSRGYLDPAIVQANKSIRLHSAKAGVIRTDFGISQLLDSGYQPQ